MAALNWIFFRESDDFDSAFQSLIEAIDTDLDWVRAHTRLLVRAIEWDNEERDASFVLRGRDLEEAEQWLAQGADKELKPRPLHAEYITASRRAATTRQRVTLGAVTFGLIVAIVLALWALNSSQVAQNEAKTRATQQAIAETEAEARATQHLHDDLDCGAEE